MRRFKIAVVPIVLSLFLLSMHSCRNQKARAKEKVVQSEVSTAKANEWVSIFNGSDLAGFTMKIKGYPLGENFGNTFRVQDGILKVRYDGYGPDLLGRFGTLYIDKALEEYRLKVEYRFVGETAPGAPEWGYRDSGIQFHGQPPATQKLDQAFPMCLEYNFHGGNGTDDRPLGAACGYGIFFEIDGAKNPTTCVPATVAKTFHGDQWVTAELEIKDGKITHFVNGEEILSYANPTYDPDHETAKDFIVAGKTDVNSGYVSFQSNSHPIDFRKIELLEY